VEAHGAGLVTRQQLPFNGLSAIETFPATAEDIQLVPNSLLIDGNLATTAGLDVGFGPSAAGDRNPRHVGAAFADAVTPVNTLYVWFDRTLSTEVASALAASVAVYRSDDNRNWTAVPVVAPPFASPFANRIEVTITQTQAQYVKVVLVPLAVGVTTDVTYRDLFVTELQLFLSLPASQVPTHQTIGGVVATGTARTVFLREPELVWDLTGTVGRQRDGPTTYSVMNGLSSTQRLSRTVAANERVARVDENLGLTHDGNWQWSAGLVWKPVPTAYGTLTYAGYSKDHGDLQNSVSALGRADWYDGISTQGNVSVARVSNPDRTTDSFDASGRVQLTPNPWVSVAGSAQYNRSFTTSLTLGDVFAQYLRVDGSLTLTPVPALTATGTVSRLVLSSRPTTFGTVELNYYPLRGDLQFNFTYSRTFDTANELTSEYWIPSIRWNVSRVISLRSSYTYSTNEVPVLSLVSRVFLISLLVAL